MASEPADALRVCRLKVAPATRMCTVRPSRQTGSSSRDLGHRGKREAVGIDHGDRAAAFHFQGVVRADEGGGVLVQADADRERVVGQRRDQAAEAVALAEMLVDDEAVGQAQARGQAHAAGLRRGAFLAERDHVLAEDAGAGAGAAHGDAGGIALADQLGRRGAAEDGRQAQLVAAGEEDAAGAFDAGQAVGFLAVAAGVEIHHVDAGGTQACEDFLVAGAGFSQLAGRRDHHDIGVPAAAEADEALEDAGVVFLVLGAADRNDPTSFATIGDLAGTHAARLLKAEGLRATPPRREPEAQYATAGTRFPPMKPPGASQQAARTGLGKVARVLLAQG